MNQNYKRNLANYFLKKDFQGRFILIFFLTGIGSCITILLLLAILSNNSLTIAYENNGVTMGQTPQMLLKNALAVNWIFLVAGGTLLVLLSMVLTHRIAGPLYRFEDALEKMADGNLQDSIILRKKDEGKGVAEQLNSFTSTLSRDLQTILSCSQKIDKLMHELKTTTYADGDKSLAGVHEIIEENNNKIQATLSRFTLKNE